MLTTIIYFAALQLYRSRYLCCTRTDTVSARAETHSPDHVQWSSLRPDGHWQLVKPFSRTNRQTTNRHLSQCSCAFVLFMHALTTSNQLHLGLTSNRTFWAAICCAAARPIVSLAWWYWLRCRICYQQIDGSNPGHVAAKQDAMSTCVPFYQAL